MASKSFFIGIVFMITWACLIETSKVLLDNSSLCLEYFIALGAAGWCYQCDSRDPGCQTDLDAVVLANNKVPCNGQCYIRIKDDSV